MEQGTSDDQAFYENYLKAEYKADDAAQYDAYAISGGIFDGVTGIDFSGGAMNIEYPDVIGPINGSVDEMYYTLGNNPRKTEYAAVSYSGTFKVVNMGFPFESINTIAVRADVMTRVVDFFALSGGDPTPTPTATPTPTPTDTPTPTPTATSEPSGNCYVYDITMSLGSAGANSYGIATVWIKDDSGNDVGGATVDGEWSGLTSETISGTTGTDGKVTFESSKTKSSGTFTFCVNGVTSGLTYDETLNTETCDSISN